MATTYVALLRGINVGGKNILPMKSLVAAMERMGCRGVQTYIQSGNAVFLAPRTLAAKLAERIGDEICRSHGFTPRILLKEATELEASINNNPFKTADGKALHFFFLESTPVKPDLALLTNAKSASEKFALHGDTFYLYAPEGVGRSKLPARIEAALGVAATARNWNTVQQLIAMAGQVENRLHHTLP